MDTTRALAAFSALGQPLRLDALRLLVRAGAAGMPAGEIAVSLGVRQNTMSAALSVLLSAGLVRNLRDGRSIRYHADVDAVQSLIGFLLEDCCGKHAEPCQHRLFVAEGVSP